MSLTEMVSHVKIDKGPGTVFKILSLVCDTQWPVWGEGEDPEKVIIRLRLLWVQE
jgi:hypothetical protein